MRILLICPAFRCIGAIQNITEHLAVEFAAAGHRAAIITNRDLIGPEREMNPGVERIILPKLPQCKPLSWRHPERLVRQPRGTRELADLLRAWQPDVVNYHVNSWDRLPAIARVCRAAGVPCVHSFYGIAARGKLGDKPLRALEHAAGITTISAFVKHHLEPLAPAARAAQVIVTGVEIDAAKTATPFRRERPYIFCAARLSLFHKAIDVLVSAFAAIAAERPDLDLLITGEGPDREKIEAVISSYGLQKRVQLLALRPRAELWNLYKGATIFAMPSAIAPGRWEEGLGVVFLEAMACGIPVIATKAGGIPEIVLDGETGLLVEHNEPGEWAAALRKLLSDSALRSAMGQRASQRVAQYTWPDVARRYLEVLVAAVSARREGTG